MGTLVQSAHLHLTAALKLRSVFVLPELKCLGAYLSRSLSPQSDAHRLTYHLQKSQLVKPARLINFLE